jgi:hypothetical protein
VGVERAHRGALLHVFWLHEEVRFWGRWLNSQGVRGCDLMCKRCVKRVPALRVMRYRACRQWGRNATHLQDLRFAGKGARMEWLFLIGSAPSVRAFVRLYRGSWCCGQGLSTRSSPGQRVCVTLDMKSLPAFCMEEHAGCGSSLY